LAGADRLAELPGALPGQKSFMPARLALPRATADERVFLDPAQVQSLVNAAEDRDKAMIYTAARTGLRWGDSSASSGTDWTSLRAP
jgi:integrase